jgi:hypothetical protein
MAKANRMTMEAFKKVLSEKMKAYGMKLDGKITPATSVSSAALALINTDEYQAAVCWYGKGCYISGDTPEGYMLYPVRTTLEALIKDIDKWATANLLL